MDDIKKTPLEQAKISYEQIKKFATEAATKEFENKINETVDKILKESLSVDVDDENNVTVVTDEKVVELTNDGEIEVEDKTKHDDELETKDGEEYHDKDDEEIEIEKNIDEMITFEQEQAPEAAPVDASAAPSPVDDSMGSSVEASTDAPAEAPVEETPSVDDDVLKLAQLIDTIIDKKISGGEGETEQGVDVDYVDDETAQQVPPAAPAASAPAAPAAPAPAPAPAAPIQEDELFEVSLEELEESGMEENMLEFEIPEDDPEAMLSAAGDISKEKHDWKKDVEKEIPELDLPELEEMKGKFKPLTQGDNRLSKLPGKEYDFRNKIEESTNKIKAQYESKLDGLLKENKRLSESNKELGDVIKNYQESFKDLRKQFDEMQTFNAKLAYANKIFASGGLSTSDKAMIAEEFDKAQTVEDAKKLYNKILEENKISINKDNTSKLKASITNTVKPKNDVVYESAEMKRRKVLAGIEKNEDFL